jgi:chaperone modulatory protein CbpM
MSEDTPRGPAGEIVESSTVCTLEELCQWCQVEADWIAALVEQGALDPLGRSRHEWRFTRLSVVRIGKARRLERDLDLNPPGVALVLDLLDELDALRARLARIGAPATDPGEH